MLLNVPLGRATRCFAINFDSEYVYNDRNITLCSQLEA